MFRESWESLPRWLRATVYTVLGISVMGWVGYLGFQLTRVIVGAERMNVFWGAAGAIVVICAVFGGIGGRCYKKRWRQSETME